MSQPSSLRVHSQPGSGRFLPGDPPTHNAPPWPAAEQPAHNMPPWPAAQPPAAPTWTPGDPRGAAPTWTPSDPHAVGIAPVAGGPAWAASASPVPQGAVSDPIGGTGSLTAIAGDLIRRQGAFDSWITRDGSSGYLAEPARYQLYASLACPWSQRTLIACRLLGLDRVIGLTLTEPVADEQGWRFTDDAREDPVTGARFVAELYRATDPGYPGPYTVPLIWDLRARRIVSNDVAHMTIMLETEFRPFHRQGAPDLYPAARRREIESLATLIYHTVNTGVYKVGLARTQESYDQAVEALFTTLDALDERLARRRFLLGGQLTDADVRLYPTLARFDSVYYQMFACNLRRLTDYRHLWAYTRDLYTHPGFGETTDLGQIKRHYFRSADWAEFNRSGIIPVGPEVDWTEPHGRSRMPA
jgi:glutathionyl-hydroquinone reductase